jgi:hypothetical protein
MKAGEGVVTNIESIEYSFHIGFKELPLVVFKPI